MARYYRADIRKNKPISTEITGYFASALVFLYSRTNDDEYLDSARRAAGFLCDHAWEEAFYTFPFEYRSDLTYFFDCGIIIRGLLAVWRVTKEQRLLDIAVAASQGMLIDFHAGADFHPILSVPDKQPLPREDHWSRASGCHQLKAALAWLEVADITGDDLLRNAYVETLESALCTQRDFLPGASEKASIMDRLHPYCYFLEGLTPVLDRPDCAEALRNGIETVAQYVADIAPEFLRSDVCAQLMRARATLCEAAALMEFQVESDDPKTDGAFLFGRRDGQLIPHANPVSTTFAIQALERDAGSPI